MLLAARRHRVTTAYRLWRLRYRCQRTVPNRTRYRAPGRHYRPSIERGLSRASRALANQGEPASQRCEQSDCQRDGGKPLERGFPGIGIGFLLMESLFHAGLTRAGRHGIKITDRMMPMRWASYLRPSSPRRGGAHPGRNASSIPVKLAHTVLEVV